MNNEFEGIWNEPVVSWIEMLFLYLPGGTVGIMKYLLGDSVSLPSFEPKTFRI
jgi:hypothetical protein